MRKSICVLLIMALLVCASFTTALAEFTVELIASPEEGGTVDGGGTFQDGSTVTIHATPNDGYTFVGWYRQTDSEPFSTDTEFVYELGEDRVYTARFEQEMSVGAIAEPADGGKISINEQGPYTSGQSVTVTATPEPGYAFVGWFDGTSATDPVSVDSSYTFAVTSAVSLVARFSPQYTLHVNISPEDTGTITGTGTYAGGSIVTLQAIPYDDYRFIGWVQPTDPDRILSTDESYTFNLEGDVNLTATFGRSYGYIWLQIGMWALIAAAALFAVWYVIKRRQLVLRRQARSAAGRTPGGPPRNSSSKPAQPRRPASTVVRRPPRNGPPRG
ncbi:MAG: InlB B-repeat-containing protein [Clostridia bacterium]|nr:InlB B-repeat-containing protein [Clostridia bacterium]